LKSAIVKRSVVVHGHKTSVSLEKPFWQELHDIAKSRRMTLSDLIGLIDSNRNSSNLFSTIRLFVLTMRGRSLPRRCRQRCRHTRSGALHPIASLCRKRVSTGASEIPTSPRLRYSRHARLPRRPLLPPPGRRPHACASRQDRGGGIAVIHLMEATE